REPRRHVRDYLATTYRHHDTDLYYWTSALAFSRAYLQERLPVDMSLCAHLWINARLAILASHFGSVITLEEPATGWRRHASSDSIRIRSRRLQLRNTLARAKVFNAFCRPRGWPTISPWKSRRFYLQLLRYLMPDALYDVYYRSVRRRG